MKTPSLRHWAVRAAWAFVALTSVAATSIAVAAPQIPDFVYQGRLTQNGAPANGNFDLHFALFDAPAGGTQVGSTIDEPAFPVTDGLFSVSLSFPGAFTGTQLYLQVVVGSTPLLPRQAVATVPVAQFTLNGSIGPAGGDLAGMYPNPQIAFGAVTNGKIAPAAVTNSKIASGAVSSGSLADDAVTAAKIASSAVTTASIASDSITRGKIAGGYSNGAFGITVGADDCVSFDVSVPGAQVNDMVIFNLQGAATLPAKIIVQPLGVSTDGLVTLRACNFGATSTHVTNLPIYILTLR